MGEEKEMGRGKEEGGHGEGKEMGLAGEVGGKVKAEVD